MRSLPHLREQGLDGIVRQLRLLDPTLLGRRLRAALQRGSDGISDRFVVAAEAGGEIRTRRTAGPESDQVHRGPSVSFWYSWLHSLIAPAIIGSDRIAPVPGWMAQRLPSTPQRCFTRNSRTRGHESRFAAATAAAEPPYA